ncbi:hypothetical protein Taro_046556 [Colocasia esculenta]|uniref:Uncharacterized protein n=1 Tax=Colocasia esculenta TaxID=4460 RepID=A0A843WZ40_COLES|nr:hypothetical protein [Colocasia esculenta]
MAPKSSSRGKSPQQDMPLLSWVDFPRLTPGYDMVAVLADSSDDETDTMDVSRLDVSATPPTFARDEDYRVDYPKDKHLLQFLHSYAPGGKKDSILTQEVEAAILIGRDSLAACVPRAEPLYRIGGQRRHAPVLGLGDLVPVNNKLTRAPTFVPARWDNSSGRVHKERSSFGLFLCPTQWGYRDEPFLLDCLAIRFKHQLAAGWFGDLRATDAHHFRTFVVEAADFVLHNYAPLLMTAGVYHSVFAARYRYHLSKGLCCGLAEVFVPEYNTFYTAEGETSLDLWIRGDPSRDRYAYTSWLFVLLHVHNLTVEADYESILAHELHVSFQYADGWGMDYLSLYYFLSSVGQADLAIFAEDCCQINDVYPSAKDRRRRYHVLIMKVKRPSYFAEEKILYKPLTEKLSAKESSIASSIARAQRASKRKREASPSPSISTEGPSIPSFEEFCNQREDAGRTDMAVDSPVVRTVDERPTKKAAARRVKRPPVPFRTSQRAAGRAALLKIRQGGRAIAPEELQKPVAISSDESSGVETVYGSPSSSGSLSDDGSLFRERKRERIPALDGIIGDSSSSGEKSLVVTSRPEATISPEHVLDFKGVQDTNTPESSPTVGVDLSDIGEPKLNPLSADEMQGVAKEPAPEVEVSPPLALSGDSTSTPQVPTTQLVKDISGKEVVFSEAAATPATSGGALNVFSAGTSLSSAGLASCSTVVDASLWAEVDAQVEFQVPTVGPSGDFCSSDAMVHGQLSSLRTLVRQNPAIPYERVKAAADQMTGVLVIMGCSLDDWANRVTLLLKLLKRRDYFQRELSDQMNALEIQQSDCKAVLNPLADDLEHRRSTWVARDSTGVQVGNAAAPWGESRLQSEASHNCTSSSSVDVCCPPVIPGGGGGNHSSSGVSYCAGVCGAVINAFLVSSLNDKISQTLNREFSERRDRAPSLFTDIEPRRWWNLRPSYLRFWYLIGGFSPEDDVLVCWREASPFSSRPCCEFLTRSPDLIDIIWGGVEFLFFIVLPQA